MRTFIIYAVPSYILQVLIFEKMTNHPQDHHHLLHLWVVGRFSKSQYALLQTYDKSWSVHKKHKKI